MVDLIEEEFNMFDDQMRYQLKDNKLYIEIAIPADLKEVISKDNLNSSGKIYRVYSNGTNKFSFK